MLCALCDKRWVPEVIMMRCPTLKELPPPPPGKTGWPWTEESPQLPDAMPDGRPWPRISIVTPNYNYGQFIEETIRSVLLQGYPNLEYIIIDGGSTDNSVEIIKKYEPWLAYWVSEPDRGQSHAINKGFARVTGQIMAWINSDDYYSHEALTSVVQQFVHGKMLVIGEVVYVDDESRFLRHVKTRLSGDTRQRSLFMNGQVKAFRHPQPAMFWTNRVFSMVGQLSEDLCYVMDLDFLLRAMSIGITPAIYERVLAYVRLHENSKSCSRASIFNLEEAKLYWRLSSAPGFRRFNCYLAAGQQLSWYFRKQMIQAIRDKRFAVAIAQGLASAVCYPNISTIRATLASARSALRERAS